ncbi:MAG: outer membrane beta-barrel protein [Muribaculaceae bacterium]
MMAVLLGCAGYFAEAAIVRGRIVDATDKSGLTEATVRLVKAARDSAYVAGAAADAEGNFRLAGVRSGKYVLTVSYIGYSTLKKNITVGAAELNLGDIPLQESTIMLKEATVVGVKTEITVKEDTVEYNADSYKTQPNAVVEDLLKRLPGVEVGSDGKITAQGKEVTKILIDGKEFFADDPKVASKNIPVNMVDKLQVVDRKSDLARMTGVDDGEDETVINLTVKKGMNNGWFGTVTGGYGTDKRYTGSLMVNHFRDGNQFTILGGANNTNEPAFTDGGSSRFMRFGGSNGINTTQSAGVNFNVGKEETFRVGGSVLYTHTDQDSRNKSNYQYLLADGNTFNDSYSTSRDNGHNVRGDFRLKWEADSFNTFEFRPNFSFNFSDSEKTDSSMMRNSQYALQSKSVSSYLNNGKSYEFGGQLVYNHKFKSHPGRSYSAQLRYNFSNVREDGSTVTRNTYADESTDDQDIDQIYDNHRWSNTLNWRLTWTEPLGNVRNARFITVAYRGNYKFNNADKFVYDIERPDGTATTDYNPVVAAALGDAAIRRAIADKYSPLALLDYSLLAGILDYELGTSTFNDDLSSRFRNDLFTQEFQLGFKQVRKTYNLDAGVSLNSSMMKSDDLLNPARNILPRWTWHLAPYARVRMKFSKTRNLAIDYRSRYNEPSITQLQPVADVSNPLRIVVGNPDLKSTFTQRFNIRFNDFNQEAQRSIMAMVGGQYALNSIISKVTYDPTTGGQTTTYENVNGVWNAYGMTMFSFPFKRKSWYYSMMSRLSYSSTVGFNNEAYNRSGTFSLHVAPGISFRPDNLELELRPTYNYQTTHNTTQTSANRDIHTYGARFNGTYYAPFGFVIGTDLNYSSSSGYSDGYNTTQWLWNASLSYQFLHEKSATIAVKVFDILGQRQNISRSVTANYIRDMEYNTLTRYVMFTFTYKFTTFGSQKDNPKMDGFDIHGRGGFGGPRRPMGPPPGH